MAAGRASWCEVSWAMLLGILAFLVTVGPRVLDPTNIAWLSSGDPAQHYLGWLFFRQSSWSFPVGLNPTFGLELSASIVFTDSLPLLALLLKPFSALLPQPFQYFGLWLLACFVLHALFAWRLLSLVTTDPVSRSLAVGLFLFAPPMLWRLGGHLSLSGHFIVLAALYLALKERSPRHFLSWLLLILVAALVHPYLLLLVLALWSSDMIRAAFDSSISFVQLASRCVTTIAVLGLTTWQAGYFEARTGVSTFGFGHYRMDLLSIFDSNGWSRILADLPSESGEYEGFNYLGLGALVLAIFVLPTALSRWPTLFRLAKQRWPLLGVIVLLSLFAVSNVISVGKYEIQIPAGDYLLALANTFRASGRMFWPAFYLLLLTLFFLVVRGNDKQVARLLLAIAFVLQVFDTQVKWGEQRRSLMAERSSVWETPLVSPWWSDFAASYESIRWLMPGNNSPKWQVLAAFAGVKGLSTDAVYLARVDSSKLEALRARGGAMLSGSRSFEPDSLYFLDDASAVIAALSVNQKDDLLAKVDGFVVLAPGWRKLNPEMTVKELEVVDVLPRVPLGERLKTSEARFAAHLSRGWSSREPWGVWSEGETADLVFGLSSASVREVEVEAIALVTPDHPRQRVVIQLNGTVVETVELTSSSSSRIKISVPASVNESVRANGYLHVALAFPDAVSPISLRLNNDRRVLAIGIEAATLK